MKKYLVVLLLLTVLVGSKAVAQEQEKLHGAAKHHRSPDAETSHKGKKHAATESNKNAAGETIGVKPQKSAAVPKHEPKPAAPKPH